MGDSKTFGTAWGSLVDAMEIQSGQTLLVRGGTSSVGMAAIAIAKDMGLTVIATTRTKDKEAALHENGADIVLLDDGKIAEKVKQLPSIKVNAVLELVGAITLRNSLQSVASKGIVCNTGILGNSWVINEFEPLADIPGTVKLTVFESTSITSENPTWIDAMQKIVVELRQIGISLTLIRFSSTR